MKTTNSVHSKTSIWLGVLYCTELVFCVVLAGCGNGVLQDVNKIEYEALKYGTVSVGAVRVNDYNESHLQCSRKRLRHALEKIQKHLANEPITSSQEPSADGNDSNKKPDKTQDKENDKAQAPWLGDIDEIGLRMAALKFVESELEDIDLDTTSPIECNFRRVVVSLDCSAWVRGKAGAALVYIDLYPYKADGWCHEAAKILECWWNGEKIKDIDNCEELEGIEHYKCCWNKVIEEKLQSTFKSSALPARVPMPNEPDIKKRNPKDWVGFCHGLLAKQELLPHIAHVERMGKAEYLTLAESDQTTSKLGIGIKHPAGPSAEYERETRREDKRQMESIRQLSLAFVAGNQRAGWLFMPGESTEGRMAPTERRLRIVVDVPKELQILSIHVHKVFLGPDLGILDGATFSKHVENLNRSRRTLTKADDLYEKYKEIRPRHYRLIKSRIRNLLYQGWADEIRVEMPKSKN